MTDRERFRRHLDACPDCYLLETGQTLSTKFCGEGQRLWQDWGQNWFAALRALKVSDDGAYLVTDLTTGR